MILEDLRSLSQDFVYSKLGNGTPPDNLDTWYRDLHDKEPDKLYKYLSEKGGEIQFLYVILPDKGDPDLAILEKRDHISGNEEFYPFFKTPGNKAYFGAVMKRGYSKEKGPSPKHSVIKKTLDDWQSVRDAGHSYSPLFDDYLQVAHRTKIRMEGQDEIHEVSNKYPTIIDIAVQELITETKTVFLALTDLDGKLPGEVAAYRQYIMEYQPEQMYITDNVGAYPHKFCSLCGAEDVTVYPQGPKGAGFNIMNQHRPSAFPNSDRKNGAWKKYGVCLACARLLSIGKIWVVPTLQTSVAGASALLLPSVGHDIPGRLDFIREVQDQYDKMIHPDSVKHGAGGVQIIEQDFLNTLTANQQAMTSISILWGSFGQDVGKIRGIALDIFPSRLRDLSEINAGVESWDHPVFPEGKANDLSYRITLGMRCMLKLFSRVATITSNPTDHPDYSGTMFQFRRELLEAVFAGRPYLGMRKFEDHMYQAMREHYHYNFGNPDNFRTDFWEKGQKPSGQKVPYTTISCWVKHMARFIYYLRHVGALDMDSFKPYVPSVPELAEFLGVETGIDTPSKAFAFWIGVLEAKVLLFQRHAKRRQSALDWLKGLQLRADQLPELYTKQYDKLSRLDQEAKKTRAVLYRKDVRFVTEEISDLGIKLGNQIDLTVPQTNYYLLLGMGIARRVSWWEPTDEKDKESAKTDASTSEATTEEVQA